MSKRQRKGAKKDGGSVASAAPSDIHPLQGQDTAEAEAAETDHDNESGRSEPKRRSSRLSARPAPAAVAPVPAPAPADRARPAERKAKRSQPRTPAARPAKAPSPAPAAVGYTSDGMSFGSIEDGADGDDDMLPDMVMESPSKERKYLKDDIVWAPHKDMYWPAIVTSVKLPNVCYLYINDSGEHVFRKHVRQLLPFDNPSKNLELKELGEKADAKFKDAYELVIKYLVKRKQNNNLNARHFLTLNQNDTVAQAKTCLLRLTGSFDGFDNEEDKSDEEVSNTDFNSDDEENCSDKQYQSSLHTDGYSPTEKAKVEEILRDLETLPTNMTVSSEQYKEMEKEAKQLLEIIRSEDCFNHLMQIRKGSTPSSRHSKYAKNELLHGGLGPFTLFQDLTNELLTVLDNHCDKYDSPNYKQAVMLPEAIFYAITKVMECSKLDAKRHFHKTCEKVGVQD